MQQKFYATPVDTVIIIRSDGSASITEYDGDCPAGPDVRNLEIGNPDGIDIAAVCAQYLIGKLVIPAGAMRIDVRECPSTEHLAAVHPIRQPQNELGEAA